MAEQQAVNNGSRKKKKALLIVGTVVVLGLIFGFFYSSYRKTHITTDDAFIQGDIHSIAFRVSGTVQAIHVSDNQRVKEGDLLVELDPADYRTRRDAARANLLLQQANLRFAEQELKRARALLASEAGTADRFDRAVSAYDIAQAQVKLAEAQLQQAELNLSYTRITAPADGYVTQKSVQIGNQVKDNQPLMAVVSLSGLWVVANYKETDMERIRPGQEVRITVDTYPGKTFRGAVDSIMAGTGVSFSLFPPENATGNYVKVVQRIPVKILLDQTSDPGHVLRVGMSVVPTVLAR
jgi:membrane fusion protein (multidrug efflux system)